MNLVDLDDTTRAAMLREIELDLGAGRGTGDLYLSPRLSALGAFRYPDLLRRAARQGDVASFTDALAAPGILVLYEKASHPLGGPDLVKVVPRDAPRTLAEGEFGRFYARGICVRALAASGRDATVTVYRARRSCHPRRESERLANTSVSAGALLHDLRARLGVDDALGLPSGERSGLSVRL